MKITRRQLRRLIKEELSRIVEVTEAAVDDTSTAKPEGVKISDLISYLQGVQGSHGDLVINHPGFDKINRPPKPPSGNPHSRWKAWTHPHTDPNNYVRSKVEDWFNLNITEPNKQFSEPGSVEFGLKRWLWDNYGLGGMSSGRR